NSARPMPHPGQSWPVTAWKIHRLGRPPLHVAVFHHPHALPNAATAKMAIAILAAENPSLFPFSKGGKSDVLVTDVIRLPHGLPKKALISCCCTASATIVRPITESPR